MKYLKLCLEIVTHNLRVFRFMKKTKKNPYSSENIISDIDEMRI